MSFGFFSISFLESSDGFLRLVCKKNQQWQKTSKQHHFAPLPLLLENKQFNACFKNSYCAGLAGGLVKTPEDRACLWTLSFLCPLGPLLLITSALQEWSIHDSSLWTNHICGWGGPSLFFTERNYSHIVVSFDTNFRQGCFIYEKKSSILLV